MNLYDHHANISLDGGNPGYSLSDVDALFSPVVYQRGMETKRSGSAGIRSLRDEDLHDSSVVGGDRLDPKQGRGGGSENDGLDGSQGSHLQQPQQQLQQTPMPIQTVKYAQNIIVPDPVTGKPAISITAHRAGHLLGASYFILKRLADETEVVVAPVYHHAKEKHLDSSTLYQYATACDVIVTTCGGPGYSLLGKLYISSSPKMKPVLNPPSVTRDEGELIETVLSTLRRGGNVLLPTDTSGRVLELLYILNQHWERHRLEAAYNLCWVGSMVHNTLDFVRSQLEWMAAPLGAQFDSGRGHPFALKSVQMFTSVAELEAHCLSGEDNDRESRGGNPTCVLASGATLDHGPARDLFLKWSENADNTIILTDFRRCVQRGVVVQKKRRGKNRMAASTGVSSTNTNPSANLQTLQPSASSEWEGHVVSSQGPFAVASTKDGIQRNIGMETVGGGGGASGSETPNMVQEEEEEESAGTINIGTGLTVDQVSDYCTSAQLLLKWCEAKSAGEEMADVVECDVPVPKRAPLAGAELKAFLKQEEAKRLKEQAAEERRAMLREVELAKGRLRLNEEDPGASSSIKQYDNNTAAGQTNDGKQRDSLARPKKKSRFDAELFLKFSKPCHCKFVNCGM
jgi:cleavage and polyadenylation specificity factor subunit 2